MQIGLLFKTKFVFRDLSKKIANKLCLHKFKYIFYADVHFYNHFAQYDMNKFLLRFYELNRSGECSWFLNFRFCEWNKKSFMKIMRNWSLVPTKPVKFNAFELYKISIIFVKVKSSAWKCETYIVFKSILKSCKKKKENKRELAKVYNCDCNQIKGDREWNTPETRQLRI